MYCVYCGHEIPADAVFCSACGKKQGNAPVNEPEPAVEKCHIELWEHEAKWSLFGRTTNKFQVIDEKGNLILESDKFKLTGFSYDGPEETSKAFRDMVDKLVLELAVQGWKKLPGYRRRWFELDFEREIK